MKPIVERMLSVTMLEMLRESVLQPEAFHLWLSNIGEKHKSAITKFHSVLLQIFNNDETASSYAEGIRMLVTENDSKSIEDFLDAHPNIESFLNENIATIEMAAADYFVSFCLTELDKNFDYEDAFRRTLKLPVSQLVPKPQTQTPQIETISSKPSEAFAPPKASFVITDKVVRFIESTTTSSPITSQHILDICRRLEKLVNRQRFGYLLELYRKLADDIAMAETICRRAALFNFKSIAAENCNFIKECLSLQMSLLMYCSSESIQLFSESLKEYLAISKQEDYWWKKVYTILNENNALKDDASIVALLDHLKAVKPDIDVPEEYAPTEPSTPIASLSSSSSQDQLPAEDDVPLPQVNNPPALLRTYSGTEVRRVRYARQGSMPDFDSSRRYSIYNESRKRVNALTSDNPTVISESKRFTLRN